MKKACMQLSEAVWTITYVINPDNTVTIHNFDREDNDGYMFAHILPVLQSIKEGDGRIAETITVDGQEYVVKNQQNIFTYKLPL